MSSLSTRSRGAPRVSEYATPSAPPALRNRTMTKSRWAMTMSPSTMGVSSGTRQYQVSSCWMSVSLIRGSFPTCRQDASLIP